jgi:hypothetical protein
MNGSGDLESWTRDIRLLTDTCTFNDLDEMNVQTRETWTEALTLQYL